jgi:hypothetical protein
MEADVTTPEQGRALALFDTPLDELGRRHRRRLLRRPGPLLARHVALRAPARAHRRRLRRLCGRVTGDGGPVLPVSADVCIGTDKLAER